MVLAKILTKIAISEMYVGIVHTAEQRRVRRAKKEARDMRNTKFQL